MIDGQMNVQMKDGTPVDFNNVAYIDYGVPAEQYAANMANSQQQSQSQTMMPNSAEQTRPQSTSRQQQHVQHSNMPNMTQQQQQQYAMPPMGNWQAGGQPMPYQYYPQNVMPSYYPHAMQTGVPMHALHMPGGEMMQEQNQQEHQQ